MSIADFVQQADRYGFFVVSGFFPDDEVLRTRAELLEILNRDHDRRQWEQATSCPDRSPRSGRW